MVRVVPPPICTAATSWAAMPATWETTARLMVVLPRSAMYCLVTFVLPIYRIRLINSCAAGRFSSNVG
jgi:hypothetical protein